MGPCYLELGLEVDSPLIAFGLPRNCTRFYSTRRTLPREAPPASQFLLPRNRVTGRGRKISSACNRSSRLYVS